MKSGFKIKSGIKMKSGLRIKSGLDNKGFSMIELIVTIAILAIATGFAMFGISMLNAGDTKKASKSLSGEIAALRSSTLAKAGVWQLEIYNDNDSIKTVTYQKSSATGSSYERKDSSTLGSRISLYYSIDKTNENMEDTALRENARKLQRGEKLIISFVQSTGKIADIKLVSGLGTEAMSSYTEATADASIKGKASICFMCMKNNDNLKDDIGDCFTVYNETGKVMTE